MSQLQTEPPRGTVGVTPPTEHKSPFRPEVQGLRALAVLMVVTYHIWFGRVSGGVDIFLLISAFLLTLSFIRKVESGLPLDLGRYWLRQFKRLLPPVAVVLAGVLAATGLFVPQSRWSEILSQSWSSLLYFQNWLLAAESVDYYAVDHSTASPLQHFWSLSVQGQVFILWPLLFAASAFLARTGRIPFRRVVLAVFGAVFIVSLSFSIAETYGNQAHAYFDTRTRLWEFALGTLLALALPYVKLPRSLRIMAGWLGLGIMFSVGFLLDVQGQFPGYVALWPLAAAALVITAGQTGSRFGADRLLSWRPLIRLGDMSYALYLWHWPVLVIYLIWRGREEVGPVGGTAVIGLSLLLAYLTTRLVERPLRSAEWANRNSGRSAVVIALCLAFVAAPVAGWEQGLRVQSERAQASAELNNPGAAALAPDYVYAGDPQAPLLPTPEAGAKDYVSLETPCTRYASGAAALQGSGCSEIVSPENPDKIVVAVGNSHVQQWLAGLAPIAAERNWALIALIQGGCQFETHHDNYPDSCNERNEQALDYVTELNADAVVTTATYSTVEEPYETIPGGVVQMAREVMDRGMTFVGIRDNPRHDFHMGGCAEDYGADAPECNLPYYSVRSPSQPLNALQAALPDARLLDVDDLVCPGGVCSAVIGNVRVYVDDNHLTQTYVSTMAPELGRRFASLVGW